MEYKLIRSKRRTLAIEITRNGEVVARAPYNTPVSSVERFIAERRLWIEKHLKQVTESKKYPPFTSEEIKDYKQKTKLILSEKVPYFADRIGVFYGKITVRKQRTVWGSCNRKGDLNFNMLISALPEKYSDYIIVHELCHIKRMDHSPAFWEQVKKYCADYKEIRKNLRAEYAYLLRRV